MNQVKNNAKQIIGFVMTVLNVLWTGHWVWLFYAYHFTNILWLYMYPDWVLISNISVGLIGIYLGYGLIKSKVTVLVALIIDIPIFIWGLIVSYYIPQ